MECTLSIIQKHKFINRGFLIGPYCPIYGVGVVGVTIILSKVIEKITNNWQWIIIFILAIILCGSLEYFTSYIMEKIFNARWWDYSQKKFNIKGRICAETLIPFGILSVVILKYTNPVFLNLIYKIPQNTLTGICIALASILIIDVCCSFKIISSFKNLNKQSKDNTEEISKRVKETAEATIGKLTNQKELLLRKIKINRYSIAKNIRYTRKKSKDKLTNKKLTILNNLKNRIQSIDEKIKTARKDAADKISNIRENQAKIYNEIKEKFMKKSKLNKRLISAFPNVEHKEYTRKRKKAD